MGYKTKISVLTGLSAILILVFLFTDISGNWSYILSRRITKLAAMILTGAAIAFSTVVFQTITNNRILTPSILGLDSLYMLIQTFLIFAFGSMNLTMLNQNMNFLLSVGLMIAFAGLLYKLLFKGEQHNIYFLLLIGLVIGTLFESLSTFMQVLLDPNEFMVVQDRMFASFNNVNDELLIISSIGLAAITLYALKFLKYLDVLSLGRDQAVNLGVNYDYVIKRLLIIIAVMVSVSTALVGPITFLGLLVANVAHEFMRTYRHHYLILGAVLISFIALIGGQLLVERAFTFSTTLSVIVNFVGGVYFIYLLLKESKKW
ncbi:iron chelate uptake ABC transporter family permease subunit [Virgibacillus sp. MSP4-1]|uniref:iron chelate uptake ABC transporter family permease subunit n=1 Tax=Virgibacillus sp. MSP4-1 TaxID=2700081 RepID=UPI00039AE150|nr:iron chelate uptake ABC transporter family permease subunit [Virgibacillus sp. MSP4-1]QHS23184.1 iron chelate uptake ABC transporter family permease subunit [Virgibacillus sp. MSP4-1]